MTAATLLPLSRPLYVHGTPNWVDLRTVDVDTATSFYGEMFGWSFQKRFSLSPVPGTVAQSEKMHVSHMAGLDRAMVAEVVKQPPRPEPGALPSEWVPYVSVVDLTATLRRVEGAGGTVISGPTRRSSLAVTATVAGPDNARLSLWQPKDMAGVGVVNQPGSLAWLELETEDVEQACTFYRRVFGWTRTIEPLVNSYYDRIEEVRGDYTVFSTPLGSVAGVIRPTVPDVAATWCPAFEVADVDLATAQAIRLGGVVMAEPYDIPRGRQSVILDPTGATFAILGPKTETRRL